MISAKGTNGQVEFDGDVVTISRRGFSARIEWGNTGKKRIPIASITSVQVGRIGFTGMIQGYIRFVVIGNVESGPGEGGLRYDQNAILFHRNRQVDAEFEKLRAAVEAKIIEKSRPYVVVMEQESNSLGSRLEQLKVLGELRNSGVLSDDEFTKEKNLILNSESGEVAGPVLGVSSPADLSTSEVEETAESLSRRDKIALGVLDRILRSTPLSRPWTSLKKAYVEAKHGGSRKAFKFYVRCNLAMCTLGLSEFVVRRFIRPSDSGRTD